MRTLLYCLALVLVSLASAGVKSLTAKVPSGVKSRITGHSAVDNNTFTAQRGHKNHCRTSARIGYHGA